MRCWSPPGGRAGDRDGSAYYRDTVMALEYATLWQVAIDNLRLGVPVVLDAPFGAFLGDPGQVRDRLGVLVETVRCTVIQVRPDEATNRRQLEQRGLERDRWKLEHWSQYWSGVQAARCTWQGVRLTEITDPLGVDVDELARNLR